MSNVQDRPDRSAKPLKLKRRKVTDYGQHPTQRIRMARRDPQRRGG